MKTLKKTILCSLILSGIFNSCDLDDYTGGGGDNELTFSKIGGFTNGVGDEGFAEISAFDPETNKLFIVNANDVELSVWDLSDPSVPVAVVDIALNGIPNSVSVHNGIVAVALENAADKQAEGTIATFDSDSQSLLNTYGAGALPDMVTFSPNGKYIVAANEGEPNDLYTNDPEGSITIIEVASGQVSEVSFTNFNGQDIGNDFRVFGPGASLAQDVEPEYVAISDDSRTAYVTLQENNGIAIVDLQSKMIRNIVGLGVKDYSQANNQIDASDKDDIIGNFQNWPVLSYYHPDAITYAKIRGARVLITANEGDARDYDGYSEEERVKDLTLDPEAFPNAATLQLDENLGRLKTTTANGDLDGDGDYDVIHGYGARSFSIWSTSGILIYDSGDQIGKTVFELDPGSFNSNEGSGVDKRSDDKGAEPEAVETLKVGSRTLLFVGLERTGGIMIYDISNPFQPVFLEWLRDENDISPEGLIAVKADDSPTGKDLVIVTNEVSNTIAIYEISDTN
ncbi:choice-of-anchor I family protein [Aquimarina sp. 2201CG5-10]|uniref:choice-of-anchor I family protein n=1 Tax=Aquimarina callyspongiae TaxID=3098150 RepID=UPI002AB4899F|nr:choice-of-anchor I family protein [Aquimarina sp. 2201CG5-10]MDY8134609.1 choice-of-anchor I family protein [Aquimarina sp. 2201CG5-10]